VQLLNIFKVSEFFFVKRSFLLSTVFRIRIRIHRIHMFLDHKDPDPLVRDMDPDPAPDPSIIKQK
jgi:hypothetical protein